MAQYYVVRDKNTGLYFRGKGVNRWGKHYNQASIYRVRKMAENTIKEVSWRGEQAEVVPIQIIETEGDVVPKSEEGAECPTCHGTGRIGTTNWLTKNMTKKQIAEEKAKSIAEHEQHIKAEVAREIFAEIEKVFERLKKRECSNAVCTWCVHANSYGQRNEECDKPYIDKNGKERKACYSYAKFESNIDNEFAKLKKKYTEDQT